MYKDINEFKKGHQFRAYIKKDGGKIVADITSMLSKQEQFYSDLLNVNQNTALEESEIYTAEPYIPEPRLLEINSLQRN